MRLVLVLSLCLLPTGVEATKSLIRKEIKAENLAALGSVEALESLEEGQRVPEGELEEVEDLHEQGDLEEVGEYEGTSGYVTPWSELEDVDSQGSMSERSNESTSGFSSSDSICTGLSHGPYFVEIGNFRFGQVDDNHFSISGTYRRRNSWATRRRDERPMTAQIFRNDGTLHPGPRIAWDSFGVMKALSGTTSGSLQWGDRFFQVGKWRMGAIDDTHFGVAHKDGKTVQTYQHTGARQGPKNDPTLWGRPVQDITKVSFSDVGIYFGDNFIQFGDTWRLGQIDINHASIAWREKDDGKGGTRRRFQTPQIFRIDGTLHPGPRTNWNDWPGTHPYSTADRAAKNCIIFPG